MLDLKIECPNCAWKPDGKAFWICTGCSFIWNTFDTAARCPSCSHQHQVTACIPHAGGCYKSAPHIDWYKGLDEILEEEIKDIKVEAPAQ